MTQQESVCKQGLGRRKELMQESQFLELDQGCAGTRGVHDAQQLVADAFSRHLFQRDAPTLLDNLIVNPEAKFQTEPERMQQAQRVEFERLRRDRDKALFGKRLLTAERVEQAGRITIDD